MRIGVLIPKQLLRFAPEKKKVVGKLLFFSGNLFSGAVLLSGRKKIFEISSNHPCWISVLVVGGWGERWPVHKRCFRTYKVAHLYLFFSGCSLFVSGFTIYYIIFHNGLSIDQLANHQQPAKLPGSIKPVDPWWIHGTCKLTASLYTLSPSRLNQK